MTLARRGFSLFVSVPHLFNRPSPLKQVLHNSFGQFPFIAGFADCVGQMHDVENLGVGAL